MIDPPPTAEPHLSLVDEEADQPEWTAADYWDAAIDYWAAAPTDRIASLLEDRIEAYYQYLRTSGRAELYRRAECWQYGRDPDGRGTTAAISYAGEQGEITYCSSNHFRSLNEHVVALVTQDRPAMDARPINTDSRSLAQADLANSLLDFYLSERRIEAVAKEAATYQVYLGEGWLHCYWDEDQGDQHGVDPYTGAIVYAGDIDAQALRPVNVIRDVSAPNVRRLPWVCIRTYQPKHDQAALYPAHRETILQAGDKHAWSTGRGFNHRGTSDKQDHAPVFDLYVNPSPALPLGRHVRLIGGEVIFDTDLGYDKIPVLPMVADPEPDCPFGHTISFDLMNLQEALNAALSTAITNHDSFGVQNIWTELGSQLELRDLGERMTLWESASEPKAVNLTEISPDTYKLIDLIQGQMQTLRGINETARGLSSANRSGAMGALMHAMASQYNSPVHNAYGQLLEETATHMIRVLQQYATVPRIVEISGWRGRALQRAFKGEDVSNIRRVKVDIANSLLNSTAGRQQIADALLERQVITDPRQYLEMIATGRLEHLTGPHDMQRRGIEAEGELLLQGATPKTLATDDHALHIQEHMALLAEPAIRNDDDLVKVIMDHIQTHHEIWLEISLKNPGLLAATNVGPHPTMARQVSPAVGLMGNAPTPSQAPDPSGPQPMGNPGSPPPTAPSPEVPGQANTQLPDLPENPATGRPPNVG